MFDVPPEYVIPLEPEPKVYEDVGHDEVLAMSVGDIVAQSSNVGTIIIQSLLGLRTLPGVLLGRSSLERESRPRLDRELLESTLIRVRSGPNGISTGGCSSVLPLF